MWAYRKVDRSQKVAIKIKSKKKLGKDFHQLKDEVDNLNILDHPYIVKYFETYDTKKDVYLVMRYVDGVNLESKIEVNS